MTRSTRWCEVPEHPGPLRNQSGRHQHRPARHRRVLRARQAGAARPRHTATTTATPRSACPRGLRLQAIVRQRRPARRLRGPGERRRHPADRRQHRRQPSDSVPAARANPNTTLIVVDPRVTKTAMMADLHLPLRPRSDLALINGIAHILHRDGPDRSRLHRRRTPTGFDELRRLLENIHARALLRRSPASSAELIATRGHRSTAGRGRRSSAGRWA